MTNPKQFYERATKTGRAALIERSSGEPTMDEVPCLGILSGQADILTCGRREAHRGFGGRDKNHHVLCASNFSMPIRCLKRSECRLRCKTPSARGLTSHFNKLLSTVLGEYDFVHPDRLGRFLVSRHSMVPARLADTKTRCFRKTGWRSSYAFQSMLLAHVPPVGYQARYKPKTAVTKTPEQGTLMAVPERQLAGQWQESSLRHACQRQGSLAQSLTRDGAVWVHGSSRFLSCKQGCLLKRFWERVQRGLPSR